MTIIISGSADKEFKATWVYISNPEKWGDTVFGGLALFKREGEELYDVWCDSMGTMFTNVPRENLIFRGGLIQPSSESFSRPKDVEDLKAIK